MLKRYGMEWNTVQGLDGLREFRLESDGWYLSLSPASVAVETRMKGIYDPRPALSREQRQQSDQSERANLMDRSELFSNTPTKVKESQMRWKLW